MWSSASPRCFAACTAISSRSLTLAWPVNSENSDGRSVISNAASGLFREEIGRSAIARQNAERTKERQGERGVYPVFFLREKMALIRMGASNQVLFVSSRSKELEGAELQRTRQKHPGLPPSQPYRFPGFIKPLPVLKPSIAHLACWHVSGNHRPAPEKRCAPLHGFFSQNRAGRLAKPFPFQPISTALEHEQPLEPTSET